MSEPLEAPCTRKLLPDHAAPPPKVMNMPTVYAAKGEDGRVKVAGLASLQQVLLADGRRLQERRAAPPPHLPASRADQIIAEGDRRRVAYRCANPTADTAMVYGAQVGYLQAQVRILANEADALNIRRDPKLTYDTVWCADIDEAIVGYSYFAGEPGRTYGPPEDCYPPEPEELELCEVWVNGAELVAALRDEVLEQIEAAALERARQRQHKGCEFDEVGG